MKKLAFLALLALAVVFSACSTGTPSTTVTTTTNGKWEAQLTCTSGCTGEATGLNFVTAFSVTVTNGTSSALDITGFGFFNENSCFAAGLNVETLAGNASLTVNSANQVTGTLNFEVTSVAVPPTIEAGNVLTLAGTNVYGTSNGTPGTTGTLSNGIVTGTWGLAGPCTSGANPAPSGTFIMCQGAATCTVP